MARRQRKSDLDLLIEAPWQKSAFLAVFGFVALYLILPAFLRGPAAAFVPLLQSHAWMVLILVGMIALAAFARSRSGAASEDGSRPPADSPGPSAGRERLPEPNDPRQATKSKLEAIWDEGILAARAARAESMDAPTVWSESVLRRMEWKRLEYLAAAYYEQLGFRAETIRCGADGGIDIKLFRGPIAEPVSIVQCKAWNSRPVGVKPVREFLGVMTHERVATGVFLTTGAYTNEAVSFARGHKIALVDGEEFLARIRGLAEAAQKSLLAVATEGDWTTPSCPTCGTKMARTHGRNGDFWGCVNFPRCRRTFQIPTR